MVGFGDVGYHWVRSLLEAGYGSEHLVVLYLPHDQGRLERAREKAAELGVRLACSPEGLPTSTKLFVHATTAAHAKDVLDQCLPVLGPGTTWVDVNSTGPGIKRQMATAVAAAGGAFADGAIMAAAWKHGHRTPVWLSGPGARTFAAWGETWGTPTVLVDGGPGAAASIKMSRSFILKGFAASLIEGLAVAELLGVRESVLRSISEDLGDEVVATFCERFIRPTMQHARRRAAEVDQAIDMGEEVGWHSVNGKGVADFLHRIAEVGGADIGERHDEQGPILEALGRAYVTTDQ